MKIECVPVEGRKMLMTILHDGEAWRTIHISIFGKKPALPRACDSIADFTQIFAAQEYQMARQYVMRRLSAMNLPSTTVVRSLKQCLVSQEAIERVVENFKEIGYLNDDTWTKGFVRRQMESKRGPRAIAQKLSQKGFDTSEIEAAMDEFQGEAGEAAQLSAIKQLLKTRYHKRNLSDFKEKQKVVAALARRGFDFSLIMEALAQGR